MTITVSRTHNTATDTLRAITLMDESLVDGITDETGESVQTA